MYTSSILSSAVEYPNYKAPEHTKVTKKSIFKKMYEGINEFKPYIKPLIGSSFMMIPSILAHECSHLLAFRILFPDSSDYSISCEFPKSISEALQGKLVCRARVKIPSKSMIGAEFQTGLMSAAGPLSDLILIAITSLASWKLRHSNPKIALTCAMYASMNSLNTFIYSLTTEGTSWGDFAKVEANLGISHRLQTLVLGAVTLGSLYNMKKAVTSVDNQEEEQKKRDELIRDYIVALVVEKIKKQKMKSRGLPNAFR